MLLPSLSTDPIYPVNKSTKYNFFGFKFECINLEKSPLKTHSSAITSFLSNSKNKSSLVSSIFIKKIFIKFIVVFFD